MSQEQQLGLPTFDDITAADPSPMAEAFRKFHRENPWVYRELRRLALDLANRGRRRYGIAGLFEVLRWHRAMSTDADDGFKLNNNHRAFYSRMLMANESRLEGFFAQRKSEADDD